MLIYTFPQSDDVVQAALMSCLIDDAHLLQYVFEEIPDFLIKNIQASRILDTLKDILRQREVLDKVARIIIKFLIGTLLDAAPDLREDILRIVLAYTFSSIRRLSHDHSIFHLVSGTSLSKDALLAGFGGLSEMITSRNAKDNDVQTSITSELIELLAHNLKNNHSEENVRFWLGMVNSDLVDEKTIAVLVVNKTITLLSDCKLMHVEHLIRPLIANLRIS
jgi:hypothetical protein